MEKQHMNDNHSCNSVYTPSVSCGAPSFSTGVTVEPFSNTTVDSQIVYQCQSGFLPEGGVTSVCRGRRDVES